jgi:S-formylglutathione hydrolase
MKAKFLRHKVFLFLMLLTFNGNTQLIDWKEILKGAEVLTENLSGLNQGEVVKVKVHSPGLVGNILKDSSDRKVYIYLPPDYKTNLNMRYPVLYLYMRLGGNVSEWFNIYNLNQKLDNLIDQGEINPFILVCPDNKNKYGGAWFANSSLAGNWEDFNCTNLINYIDNNYRTIPKPESRGIAGWSMGGHGAVKFALKYPDKFGFLYSISGALLDFQQRLMTDEKSDLIRVGKLSTLPGLNSYDIGYFSAAIAFAPNRNALGYGELPFKNGVLIDSTWQKWLKHDPVALIPAYLENPKKLYEMVLEFGSVKDEDFIHNENQTFSKLLNDNGIKHTLNIHDGGHDYTVKYRMGSHVFPFFGNKLHGTVVKLTSDKCLTNADTLVTEFDIDGTLYILPYATAVEANEINSKNLKSVESTAFSEIRVPLSDYKQGIYKVVGISEEGYISSPVAFSIVEKTPQATFLVTDLTTGIPIENCQVKINNESFQTDEKGNVLIQGCGEQRINFIYENYFTEDTTFVIFTDTTIAMTLVKDSYVKVVDRGTGQPVAGARLTHMGKATTTEINGLTKVQDLRNSILIYHIFKSKYFTQVDTMFLNPGDTAVVAITRKEATVEFLVKDKSGPVANQIFYINGLEGTTNQEGMSKFENIPARTEYQFSLENECYISMLNSIYIETDTLIQVTLEPKTISPELQVLHMGGDSLEITGTMHGEVFLVPAGTTMNPDSIRANQLTAVSLAANIPVNLNLTNLTIGENYLLVYLVETCQNISKWSPVLVSTRDFTTFDFTIYPNPVHDYVSIETNGIISIIVELSTLSGTVIYQSKIEETLHQINMSSLSSGIYFIIVKSKDFAVTHKVLKQ